MHQPATVPLLDELAHLGVVTATIELQHPVGEHPAGSIMVLHPGNPDLPISWMSPATESEFLDVVAQQAAALTFCDPQSCEAAVSSAFQAHVARRRLRLLPASSPDGHQATDEDQTQTAPLER